jgi:hypothetical protein
MEKLSRAGTGYCLADALGADSGESPVEDGDMTRVMRCSWVDEVVMKTAVRRADEQEPREEKGEPEQLPTCRKA